MKNPDRVVTFDEERARLVFSLIERDWLGKAGIFADVALPDDRLRLSQDPTEAANLFFFASITMRGAVVSDDPVRWLDRLAEVHRGIFCPSEVVARWNEEDICNLFGGVTSELLLEKGLSVGKGHMGPKYREFARSWLHNARVLHTLWGDSILKVFEGVDEFEEAFSRIDYRKVKRESGLIGMRRKIFSLLTIWLQTRKLIPTFPTPLPVDFHALRVLIGTGVASIPLKPFEPSGRSMMEIWQGAHCFRVSERITDEIAQWSQPFMAKWGHSHLVINPAIWVLSRVLCVAHYQNWCKERIIPIAPSPADLVTESWPAGYRDPCRFCPIEPFCKMVAPSGPYYRWGFIMPIERVPCRAPKQEFLPGLDPGFTGTNRSRA